MPTNLQLAQALDIIAQFLTDENENVSPLALSTNSVGIGTNTPQAELDVQGTLSITNHGDDKTLLNLDSERSWAFKQLGNGGTTALGLASVGGGGNKNFIINTTGKVGINTSQPEQRLEVGGNIKAVGAVMVSNEGDGNLLLHLGSERSWSFKQLGSGANTALELASVGGGGNKNFIINTTGNVGIGTTTPQEKLEVNGSILARDDIKLGGADCAEDFAVDEEQDFEPGTVMVIGEGEKLYHCSKAYDKKVAGVLSGAGAYKPGIILGKDQELEKGMPLALTGKVYCKVDARQAPIEVGDLLTTSGTPGHAMKAADPLKAFGAVIGKALKPLTEGQGLIPILIALQ